MYVLTYYFILLCVCTIYVTSGLFLKLLFLDISKGPFSAKINSWIPQLIIKWLFTLKWFNYLRHMNAVCSALMSLFYRYFKPPDPEGLLS